MPTARTTDLDGLVTQLTDRAVCEYESEFSTDSWPRRHPPETTTMTTTTNQPVVPKFHRGNYEDRTLNFATAAASTEGRA